MNDARRDFLQNRASKALFLLNALFAIGYFAVIVHWFPEGNPILFWLLITGEIFHLWQVLTFIYSVWDTRQPAKPVSGFAQPVDVFITVAGEPVEVVEKTARAAKAMQYASTFNVYLLNDGFVAGKDNWHDIESLAKRLGIHCITRQTPGGAKAGNINNALRETSAPFVVVFDADHVPHPDFLEKTVPYLGDDRVAFVQTPQFYANYEQNFVTGAAWEQQELFFGPLCKGKRRHNAAFMCGTNMVIRRKALDQVGGMCENNIAEDFLTSFFIHQKKWQSVYVDEVLAEGLAPEDFLSYYKQQFRWARGSLELVFRYNPFFRRGLTMSQRIEYFSAASFWLSGIVVLIDALLPLIFFYTGQVPLVVSTMALAAAFMPYIVLTLYLLQLSTNYSYTFRALAFSMSCFSIHIKAVLGILTGRKAGFSVTSKTKLTGNFLKLATPQIAYVLATIGGIGYAMWREGLSASVVANAAWAVVYCIIFSLFIWAALPERNVEPPGERRPA